MATFWQHATAQVREIAISKTAAALAFTTLLGVVPLATVAIAIVAQFPIFTTWMAALETFLLRHMLPVSASAVVHQYVMGFADRAASLSLVSLLFIAVTALMLIATVEAELNAIFRVARGRPLHRRLPLYLFGITVGPILVGASVWLSSEIAAESRIMLNRPTLFRDWIVAPVPFVLTTIAFTLTYKLVPARPVRWPAAIVGGVVASVVFELMKRGFTLYVAAVPSYELIYGALAALPVFLLWLYLCWVVVLAGAALTAALNGTARG